MARGIVKGGLNDGGSNIKSIQRGTYSAPVGETVINVTITAVDLTRAIPRISVGSTDDGNPAMRLFKCVLTSSTNLQITRVAVAVAGVSTISWDVTEYNNVKSLQSGLLTLNTEPQNLVITTVDMSKTILYCSFTNTYAGGASSPRMQVAMQLTTSTNIRFNSYIPATNNYVVQWYAIEFN